MEELENLRIGILLGGTSSEREISKKSGHAVYQALKISGLKNLSVIDVKTEDKFFVSSLIKKASIDVAFIALHGRFGEDGQIQQILDDLGIPYTGSGVLASSLAINKVASRKIFRENGLKVPKYITIKKEKIHTLQQQDFHKFPVVVKPSCQGSSIGLTIVEDKESLQNAIEMAFRYNNEIIIEEYISGCEITVAILDKKALPVIEIRPKRKFFDYKAKYTYGLTDYIIPANMNRIISSRAQDIALKAHTLLGCQGFSRVDMILDRNDEIIILELNTIPGLTSTSLLPMAANFIGIGFTELCLGLLKMALNEKKSTQNAKN